jgi:asparagine synthase (glutamine-hydrolysing)
MCGIAGIYAFGRAAPPAERAELLRMRDHMATRGPDGAGEWQSQDGRIMFGHRRLAIIDLSETGAQPMQSADGKIVVTFNGEIYNYRALRAELETEGFRFRTQSDTEVLLHLYAASGIGLVKRLRGMFAFAIWDAHKQGLLLARDPYGIKPLYYSNTSGTVRFASQVKALLAGGGVSNDPEPAGWVGFHLFGSVPEPFTSHRDVRAVAAGSTLWIDAAGPAAEKRYFSIAEILRTAEQRGQNLSASEVRGRLQTALLDSVRHHMVADVAVGIFLSAGIDSGALLGLMRDAGQRRVEAVTLAYEEYRNTRDDEVPLAAKCAAHYGSAHTIRMVTATEFRDDLPKIFAAMDQPTIDGINTWFVSKAAAELGLKAAISGLGGDEIFGGYPSFRDIPRWLRLWSMPARVPRLGDAFRHFAEKSGLALILSPKIAGALKYGGDYAGAYFLRRGLFMPWELTDIMDRDAVVQGLARLDPVNHIARALEPQPRTAFGKVAALEASLYMRNQLLRDTDWASMAHSLEVRVPLVDAQLLQAIAPAMVSLPNGSGKRLLAASPRLPLPAEIAERAKTGFGTPIADWLTKDSRLQKWRTIPKLARSRCPWARRWAYQLAAA